MLWLMCLALENEQGWEITDTQSIPFPLPGNDTHSHTILIWMIPLHCLNGDVTDTFQENRYHHMRKIQTIHTPGFPSDGGENSNDCVIHQPRLWNHIWINIPDYFLIYIVYCYEFWKDDSLSKTSRQLYTLQENSKNHSRELVYHCWSHRNYCYNVL